MIIILFEYLRLSKKNIKKMKAYLIGGAVTLATMIIFEKYIKPKL